MLRCKSVSSRCAAASVNALTSSRWARSIGTPEGVALPGVTLPSLAQSKARHQVEAGQVRDAHDAIDVRREVRVDAVAVAPVVEDAEAPVSAHPAEAQLADVAVARLAPCSTNAQRVAEVDLIWCRVGAVAQRAEPDVVQNVHPCLDAHVVAQVNLGLQTQTEIAADLGLLLAVAAGRRAAFAAAASDSIAHGLTVGVVLVAIGRREERKRIVVAVVRRASRGGEMPVELPYLRNRLIKQGWAVQRRRMPQGAVLEQRAAHAQVAMQVEDRLGRRPALALHRRHCGRRLGCACLRGSGGVGVELERRERWRLEHRPGLLWLAGRLAGAAGSSGSAAGAGSAAGGSAAGGSAAASVASAACACALLLRENEARGREGEGRCQRGKASEEQKATHRRGARSTRANAWSIEHPASFSRKARASRKSRDSPASAARLVPDSRETKRSVGGTRGPGRDRHELHVDRVLVIIAFWSIVGSPSLINPSERTSFAQISATCNEERRTQQTLWLTHGHEDHIGAVAYLLREHTMPVYGPPYTLALVREKLAENPPPTMPELIPIVPRQKLPPRPLRGRAGPRYALDRRCHLARAAHAGGYHPAHRRLQDRPQPRRSRALRSRTISRDR